MEVKITIPEQITSKYKSAFKQQLVTHLDPEQIKKTVWKWLEGIRQHLLEHFIGVSMDSWGKPKFKDESPQAMAIRKAYTDAANEVLADFKVELTTKEKETLYRSYRKAFVEALGGQIRYRGVHDGSSFAHEMGMEIVVEEVSKTP